MPRVPSTLTRHDLPPSRIGASQPAKPRSGPNGPDLGRQGPARPELSCRAAPPPTTAPPRRLAPCQRRPSAAPAAPLPEPPCGHPPTPRPPRPSGAPQSPSSRVRRTHRSRHTAAEQPRRRAPIRRGHPRRRRRTRERGEAPPPPTPPGLRPATPTGGDEGRGRRVEGRRRELGFARVRPRERTRARRFYDKDVVEIGCPPARLHPRWSGAGGRGRGRRYAGPAAQLPRRPNGGRPRCLRPPRLQPRPCRPCELRRAARALRRRRLDRRIARRAQEGVPGCSRQILQVRGTHRELHQGAGGSTEDDQQLGQKGHERPHRLHDFTMVDLITSAPGYLYSVLPTETKLVQLELPKFDISFDWNLGKDLRRLGLTLPFSAEVGDLRGMYKNDDGRPTFLTKVAHKAVIKVNEEGTEAAAVMMPVFGGGGPPPNTVEFVADHPFTFMIMEERSRVIVFMGHVLDPTCN